MISIASGTQRVWHGFYLEMEGDISFEQGGVYQLCGPNGSGKSSFMTRLLIPRLQREDAYLLHFEQQARLQLQAVRAYAALHHHAGIHDELDMLAYLLDDLQTVLAKEPKPVWIVADELHQIDLILARNIPCCLIYSAHHQCLPGSGRISFEPVDASRSVVRG